MAASNNFTNLALNLLRSPLNPFPITSREKLINDLQIKYRTYVVEFDINEGAVMLPKMFSADFCDEIYRFATLIDLFGNQFEVLVEKINGKVYLTYGWYALRDFYNIELGAWVNLLYTGRGQFGIILKDRFRQLIEPRSFVPPMKFKLEKSRVGPDFVDDLTESTKLLSYSHSVGLHDLKYKRTLTYYDITTDFLFIPYEEFGQKVFDESDTTIEVVDECGNKWDCMLIHVSFPYKHFKIGGEWKRMVAARRLVVGNVIELIGQTDTTSESLRLIRHR